MRAPVIAAIAAGLFCSLMNIAASSEEAAGSRRMAEIALSNDTLELRYQGSVDLEEIPRSHITGGFFLSEARDIVIDAGLLVPANLDLGLLSLDFGPRAYAALLDNENDDVLAAAVGVEVRFDIARDAGLAVVGKAYYAPDILTFGAADNLTDLSARVEGRVSSQLIAFAGMRWFEFDLTDGGGTQKLMDEVFVGVGWQF